MQHSIGRMTVLQILLSVNAVLAKAASGCCFN